MDFFIIFIALAGILNSLSIILINKEIRKLQEVSGLLISKIGADELILHMEKFKND